MKEEGGEWKRGDRRVWRKGGDKGNGVGWKRGGSGRKG